MWQWLQDKLFLYWMLFGTKVLRYKYIDIYAPNKDDLIVGITFSTHEYYIDAVSKIEVA